MFYFLISDSGSYFNAKYEMVIKRLKHASEKVSFLFFEKLEND